MRSSWKLAAVLVGMIAAVLATPARAEQGELERYEASALAFADGLAAAAKGLDDAAASAYEAALALDPNFVEAMVNLARVELRRGRAPRAEELAERALRLSPDYPAAHALRGLVALTRGDAEGALQALSTARGLDPQSAEALCNLGVAYYGLGLDDDAREVLDAARRRSPALPEPVLALALVWQRKGDAARAAFFYERFLRLTRADDADRRGVEVRLDLLRGARPEMRGSSGDARESKISAGKDSR